MEKEEQQGVSGKKDRRVLTLFIFAILSLLIAMTYKIDNAITAIAFQIILIFAQSVYLWNLLSDYYVME